MPIRHSNVSTVASDQPKDLLLKIVRIIKVRSTEGKISTNVTLFIFPAAINNGSVGIYCDPSAAKILNLFVENKEGSSLKYSTPQKIAVVFLKRIHIQVV